MEKEVLNIFREVFDKVDPNEVTLDSEFREWDQFTSLTLAELLARIDEKLGVKVRLGLMINTETIGDVIDAIEESK